MGSKRVSIGDFLNATDANGEIDTGLASVRDFQVMGRGSEDRDSTQYRNSGDATNEFDWTPTVAHTGGRVHYTGLTTGSVFYRWIAWGV